MGTKTTGSSAAINALLGKGSSFQGKLTFEGTVRIDGKFSGEIFAEDTLIIGEGAHVEAEIEVGTVIVYGEVLGNVNAREAVELHAPARLKGNILTQSLLIERGVVFDGMCTMEEEAEAAQTKSRDEKTKAPAKGSAFDMAPKRDSGR
jgi:cytoskeletal protein CcmA (bactofilin family)